MTPAVRLHLDAGNSVGESIVWDDRTRTLVWVDIVGRRVHRLVVATGEHSITPTSEWPTSVGLTEDGGFILGLGKRMVLWDGETGYSELAAIEPDLPDNRLNEGQVAPDGSYWVGTMLNNIADDGSPKPISGQHGSLLRVSPGGEVTALSSDRFGITNTMIWLDDGRFVTADTVSNELFIYEIADGRLVGRKPFGTPFGRGLPDGSCIDAEGYVWNCRVAGGACLARFAPDGRLDRVVELPCVSPTSCTFGGDDLATLYVTSARFGVSADHLAAHPQEGALFALDVGVKGRPARRLGARMRAR